MSESTKERLLRESLHLFASRGYEAVGVQEIVEAAGVTKPSMYHHFGSKRGLLDALLQARYEALFTLLTQAVCYDGDLPLTLLKTARAFFTFAENEPAFYRMQLSMWASGPDSTSRLAITPFFERQHQTLEGLFISVVKDHGNLRGHHVTYAITFLGILNGYITSVSTGYTDEIIRKSVKQFMYGIYAL
jgi:AcrR family transcriptional regulator